MYEKSVCETRHPIRVVAREEVRLLHRGHEDLRMLVEIVGQRRCPGAGDPDDEEIRSTTHALSLPFVRLKVGAC